MCRPRAAILDVVTRLRILHVLTHEVNVLHRAGLVFVVSVTFGDMDGLQSAKQCIVSVLILALVELIFDMPKYIFLARPVRSGWGRGVRALSCRVCVCACNGSLEAQVVHNDTG